MNKVELRKEIRRRKSEHTAEEKAQLSSAICQRIMADGTWRAAGVVLMYNALPDEVDLSSLYSQARLLGKRILLPVVVRDDTILREYLAPDSMVEGAFHIMEPVGPEYPVELYPNIDLALVPGMAFDKYGHRLGRGKGYYDRLLPRLTNAYKIGICFPFQMVENVPNEEHDILVNEVI